MTAIRAQVDMFVDVASFDRSNNGLRRTASARSCRSAKSTRSEFSTTSSATMAMQVIGAKQWYSDIEVMLKVEKFGQV